MGDDEIGAPTWPTMEEAEAAGYPGVPGVPVTFDTELKEIPEGTEDFVPHAGGKTPSPGYRERWRAMARMSAAGRTNSYIAKVMNYSPTAVSLALKKPWVQAEIERYRQEFDSDIAARVKEASLTSIDYLEGTITDDSVKHEIRSTNARWFIEKHSGKARQEVEVQHGGLAELMKIARNMAEQREQLKASQTHEVIEIEAKNETPQLSGKQTEASQDQDIWSSWINSNL